MSSSNGKFDPYPYNNPPMAAPYPPNYDMVMENGGSVACRSG